MKNCCQCQNNVAWDSNNRMLIALITCKSSSFKLARLIDDDSIKNLNCDTKRQS